jgi:uncharacterized membrane protein YqhA
MAEPNSPNSPEPEGNRYPGAWGESRPGDRYQLERRVKRHFERGLGLVQLTVLLPVVVLSIVGVGAFVYACVYAVDSVKDIVDHPFAAHNLRLFLTEIDLFLIGATLIIVAFGLYELFISRIEPGPGGHRMPAWLEMRDLNDLKARVTSMIILVIAVSFTDVLLEFGKATLDVLYLGVGSAVVIVALTAYLRYASNGVG